MTLTPAYAQDAIRQTSKPKIEFSVGMSACYLLIAITATAIIQKHIATIS
jgi:hypothetical protein